MTEAIITMSIAFEVQTRVGDKMRKPVAVAFRVIRQPSYPDGPPELACLQAEISSILIDGVDIIASRVAGEWAEKALADD